MRISALPAPKMQLRRAIEYQIVLHVRLSWTLRFAFENRAEEAFEAVLIRRRPQSPTAVDDGCGNAGDCPGIDRGEGCRLREERIGDVVVFFGLARARRIDQPAACAHAGGGVAKHLL